MGREKRRVCPLMPVRPGIKLTTPCYPSIYHIFYKVPSSSRLELEMPLMMTAMINPLLAIVCTRLSNTHSSMTVVSSHLRYQDEGHLTLIKTLILLRRRAIAKTKVSNYSILRR